MQPPLAVFLQGPWCRGCSRKLTWDRKELLWRSPEHDQFHGPFYCGNHQSFKHQPPELRQTVIFTFLKR